MGNISSRQSSWDIEVGVGSIHEARGKDRASDIRGRGKGSGKISVPTRGEYRGRRRKKKHGGYRK